MEKRLTNKEIIRKRRALRRKAQIRKIASLAIAASLGIVATVTYIANANTVDNYVPANQRVENADYVTLSNYTPKVDITYELRTGSVKSASSYVVSYADVYFYGKVLEIGTKGEDTIVSFQCLDAKRSNPIIVTFSGTVDLLPGDKVKVYGAYLNDVGEKANSIENVTIENPEDTIYINGSALVAI